MAPDEYQFGNQLGKLEAKIDAVLMLISSVKDQQNDHEIRLRGAEKFINKLAGLGLVAAAVTMAGEAAAIYLAIH